MIPQPYRDNFNTLHQAFAGGDACLLECSDKVTGKPAYVLCAVNCRDEEYELVPFARLFDDNPYELLSPPGELQDKADERRPL
jgi:Family of unknown function (DUF6117)